MPSKLYEAVNSSILGLNENERIRGNYQVHPLIRSDWKSADRLRDAQGDVPALRVNSETNNLEVNTFVAQSSGLPISKPFASILPVNYQSSQPASPSATKTHVITLSFFQQSWNNGNIDGPDLVNNLLNQDNAGTDIEGVPYFEKYFSVNPDNLPANNEAPYGLLTTDPRMVGATQNTLPLMAQAPAGSDNPILSHKFAYNHYDSTENGIEIEPKYNLFLDTSPDYESVISSVSETLIPNFYHVEISTLLSDIPGDTIPLSYIPFVLGGAVTTSEYKEVLAGSLSGSDITENQTNSQGYFQFYCNNSSILNQSYTQNYGNVAVLSPDIAFGTLTDINTLARDNRGTDDETDDLLAVDTYPFYNKITIPYDNQWDTAGSQPSIIEALKTGMDPNYPFFTLGLLVTLELLILRELKLGNAQQPDTLPFTIYDTTENNQVVANNRDISLPLRIDAVLNDLFQGKATNGNPEPNGPYEFINDLLLSGQQGLGSADFSTGATTRLGASLITAMNYEDVTQPTELYSSYSQWFNDLTTVRIQEALNYIANYRKDFGTIHRNFAIHNSEAIMYVVEKRVIPVGQTSAEPTEPVVQRLFFGRDIVFNQKGAVYYDTQIKYGVRYQYDIKQVRMIVGESYYYDSVVTIANSGTVGQGRALGNALGFYAEEAAAFQATETFAISTNLNNFQYTPEDDEPDTATSAFSDVVLQGNYVYKTYQSTDPGAASNIDQIFGVRSDTSYTLGDYQNSRQIPETDLSLLPIRIKYGNGFDGNFTGGAIPAVALNIYGPDNVIPQDDCPPPIGTDPGPGPGNDDIGDAIEEGIEEEVKTAQGQAAAAAEKLATEQQESEIVSELGSGGITTAGGLTIDFKQGLDLGRFIAAVPGGNPNAPAGAVGPIYDPLAIAQGYANNVGANVNAGLNNAGNNINTQVGNLGVSNINTGAGTSNNVGNTNIGVDLGFDVLNNMFNQGFIGEP